MFHNASYSRGGGGVRATFFISEGAKINDSMGPPGMRPPGYAPGPGDVICMCVDEVE